MLLIVPSTCSGMSSEVSESLLVSQFEGCSTGALLCCSSPTTDRRRHYNALKLQIRAIVCAAAMWSEFREDIEVLARCVVETSLGSADSRNGGTLTGTYKSVLPGVFYTHRCHHLFFDHGLVQVGRRLVRHLGSVGIHRSCIRVH